ncbi:MAG: caspase family protein [Rhizobium sp.]|nr:caspase family protein [Rhizobium sp.]
MRPPRESTETEGSSLPLSNSLCILFRSSGIAAFMLMLTVAAWAQEQPGARLALVIGNAAYTTVTPLDNAVNDAELMADSLKKAGFTVTLVTDAKQGELIRAISTFGRQLREAGEDTTGLFYYAGHGVQSFGSNFLLPVDVELSDAADLSLVAVPAQAVLRQMSSARNRTNIVILDACRDNPFSSVPGLNDNGLAEMDAPTGTFLAYSTAPGKTALDGQNEPNSPFTAALARALSIPGKPIETLFRDVRIDVLKATGGVQTPWDTSSLTLDFQFNPVAPLSAEALEMRQLWDSVRQSKDPVQVLLFLRANPDSPYTSEARSLLSELMSKETSKAPAESADKEKPKPVDPGKSERDMIETARKAGTVEAYEAYFKAFPNGTFAELARVELDTIKQAVSNPAAPDETPVAKTGDEPEQPEKTAFDLPDKIFFDEPIQANIPEIANRSIADLIKGSPLHPPIENLPDTFWKGKTCGDCHQWKADSLCEQAKTYLADSADPFSKPHPYGGAFKAALRIWARDGCR